MGLFSRESLRSFSDLYLMQLRDLYSAEVQLTGALPQMAAAASHPKLRAGFEQHLAETRQHVQRLQQIFDALGESPSGHTCEAMKGLLKEGNEIMAADADPAVRDAALIAAAQRVEHYEIAGYGSVCTYAEQVGRDIDAAALRLTLEEEKATDATLSEMAEGIVNPEAVRA